MIDVDRFKHVNDTYGHAAGDCILIEIARRLAKQCRIYDALGRYGGEEFVVLLPGAREGDVAVFAERIRAAIVAEPIEVNGCSLSVTISAGGVCTKSGARYDANHLLNTADQLLYQAKKSGRNCVVCGSL